jgi:hypothetical protein
VSLTAVRPYFTRILEAQGFNEWTDAFGTDNIPSTQIDNCFHQEFLPSSGVTTTNQDIEINVSVGITCFFQGFRDTGAKVQEAIERVESVITSCVNPQSFALDTPLKGVYLNSFSIEPFDQEGNDNIILASIVFEVRVFVCL